jgi:GAF domain-containing protein
MVADLHQVAVGAVAGSVPVVRRFVRSLPVVAGVDSFDVELVVAELVSNAVLHGGDPVEVRVFEVDDGLRVEVADGGPGMPAAGRSGPDAMTGRGLALVAALAAEWGVEPLATGGKVVWAWFRAGVVNYPGGPIGTVTSQEFRYPPGDESTGDEPRYAVDLGSVPTHLLVQAKTHVDNVVREFALAAQAATRHDEPVPGATDKLIQTVTGTFADARTQLKALAAEAAARGEEDTRVVLHLPPSAADAAENYLAALDETDIYARAAQLLTLPAPATHQVLRRWYLQSVAEQLRAASRGLPRPPARRFVEVLADEVDELGVLREEQRRLELLDSVSASLSGVSDVDEIASTVVEGARRHLGAHTAWVYLLGEDGILRSIAMATDSPGWAARFEEFPLEADTPASAVVRSGEPIVLPSLAQIEATFPSLRGVYPTERMLYVVPLRASGRTLGALSLTYRPAARIDEPSRVSFVTALSSMLAQALERALSQRQAAEANERLALLVEASTALLASPDLAASLEAVGRLAVPRLADCCVVHVVEEGESVALMVRHSDPEMQAAAERWAAAYSPRRDDPGGPASVLRTGVSAIVSDAPLARDSADAAPQAAADDARDDEGLRAAHAMGLHSSVTAPLMGRHRVVGVITLIYTDLSGRRYRPADVSLVEDLACRAALAIEAAEVLQGRAYSRRDDSRGDDRS